MASIRKRKNQDGSHSYTVQIRIKRGGEIVHQESRTFSPAKYDNPSRVAKSWARNREVELNQLEPWLQPEGHSLTIGDAILRYVEELESTPGGIGKSKRWCLMPMVEEPLLCDVPLLEADSSVLLAYLRSRTSGKYAVAPSTAMQDLIYYRGMVDYARVAWGVPIDMQYVDDVRKTASRLGIVDKSDERDRRPSLDELGLMMSYYHRERLQGGQRFRSTMPAALLVMFLIFSTRRRSEVVRLEWSDLADDQTILVRDMKHPKSKKGNHRRLFIPDRAMSIIKQMPKVRGEPRIFPYIERTVSGAFERARDHKMCAINDLRLHDLRHEGISCLFEQGWDIPRVAMVSGHTSWNSLRRYTHLMTPDHCDKFAGWEWLERLGIE